MIVLLAVALIAAGSVSAELSLGGLRAKFESALESESLEYEKKSAKLRDGYVGALERLKTSLGREGKLEQATQVLGEIEAVSGNAVLAKLPDSADYRLKSLRSKLDSEHNKLEIKLSEVVGRLAKNYLRSLDERKGRLTRAGKIREALVVREEAKRVGELEIVAEALANEGASEPLSGKIGKGNLALAKNGAKSAAPNDAKTMIDGVVEDYRPRGCYAWGECPSEFTVELSKLYVVSKIRFLLYDHDKKRRYNYQVEVSADGEEWSLVDDHKRKAATVGWKEIEFEPRDIQHVKVTGHGCSTGIQFHLVELEVYSPER